MKEFTASSRSPSCRASSRFASTARSFVRMTIASTSLPVSGRRHEDSRLLPLGVANPVAAKFTELHHRQSALAGKAIDEERLPDADAPRHENATFEHVRLVVADEPREFAQFRLRRLMGGN